MALVATLLWGTDWPATAAAAVAMLVVAAAVYVIHEVWTFGSAGDASGSPAFSPTRLAATCGAAALALGVRLALLWALVAMLGPQSRAAEGVLIALAAGGSLAANFLMARAVFRNRGAR